MYGVSENIIRIGLLPEKCLCPRGHIGEIVGDQKELDGCFIGVFNDDLKLALLRDSITFDREGFRDKWTCRGRKTFCSDSSGDIKCSDVRGGGIIVLHAVKHRGEWHGQVWRAT